MLNGISLRYSEGVHFFAKSADADWIIDECVSSQASPGVAESTDQMWTLTAEHGRGFLECRDGAGTIILTKIERRADALTIGVKLIVTGDTIHLPTEIPPAPEPDILGVL
jgi:hypothetical protein